MIVSRRRRRPPPGALALGIAALTALSSGPAAGIARPIGNTPITIIARPTARSPWVGAFVKHEFQELYLKGFRVLGFGTRHYALMAAILRYTDKHGQCWPGMSTLAAESGMDESTARETVHDLAAFGWLRVHREKREKGHNWPNLYTCTTPAQAAALAADEAAEGNVEGGVSGAPLGGVSGAPGGRPRRPELSMEPTNQQPEREPPPRPREAAVVPPAGTHSDRFVVQGEQGGGEDLSPAVAGVLRQLRELPELAPIAKPAHAKRLAATAERFGKPLPALTCALLASAAKVGALADAGETPTEGALITKVVSFVIAQKASEVPESSTLQRGGSWRPDGKGAPILPPLPVNIGRRFSVKAAPPVSGEALRAAAEEALRGIAANACGDLSPEALGRLTGS
jgi:hypothetical protein